MGKLLAGEQVVRPEVSYLASAGDKRILDGNQPQRAYYNQQAVAWFRGFGATSVELRNDAFGHQTNANR